MDLVDHEDHVAALGHVLQKSLHARLKLPPELRPRHERGQVHEAYVHVFQLVRHLPVRDPLGQRLRDRRFADARLADQARIVLLTAAENLDHALHLAVPPDDPVELARPRAFRQVGRVGREIAVFRLLRLVLLVGFILFPLALLSLSHEFGEIEERRAPVGVFGIVREIAVLHHGEHVAVEALDRLVVQSRLRDHVVDRLDPELPRALDAESVLRFRAVLDGAEEDDCHTLVAS